MRETEALRWQEAMNLVTQQRLPSVKQLYNSEDIKEGPRAFAENRKPNWKGR